VPERLEARIQSSELRTACDGTAHICSEGERRGYLRLLRCIEQWPESRVASLAAMHKRPTNAAECPDAREVTLSGLLGAIEQGRFPPAGHRWRRQRSQLTCEAGRSVHRR
jgi:hypothetical protein